MEKTTKRQLRRRSWRSSLRQRWWVSIASVIGLLIWGFAQWAVVAQTPKVFTNQAAVTYTDPATNSTFGSVSEAVKGQLGLVDPLGRITGCEGELLTDYQGFSAALYQADASGTGLGSLVSLTTTEVPDVANNGIPLGQGPNTRNSNPFFLTNGDRGGYNFLLDDQRGQLNIGTVYILVINPPATSIYSQRRIRIVLTGRNANNVSFTATALDGLPISASMMGAPPINSINGTLTIASGTNTALVLSALSVRVDICQAQSIQIVKTGDRAAAEPGDTVIYRVSVRSLSSSALRNLTVTDTLPLGFNFVDGSARAESNGVVVPLTVTRTDRILTFQTGLFNLPPSTVAQNPVLTIAYAATLSPDAIRGSGRNSASAAGQRTDNALTVRDGPVFHRMRVEEGILSICGTVIGRVFVDKNFDGEQQPGEPGVPNAVILMDDGNRITTDANGLFSVANVIAGYRTGVLDLSSLPGYTLAPNLYFIERNSQSRLVHLEPGGMVRMNFAVTPAFKEEPSS